MDLKAMYENPAWLADLDLFDFIFDRVMRRYDNECTVPGGSPEG